MSEQATVFHYECSTPDRMVIFGMKKPIRFEGGQYTTDDEKIAKEIEGSKFFKLGKVWRSDGVILGANPKRTVSGARGTKVTKPKDLSPADKLSQMKLMGFSDEVIQAAKKELVK